MNIKGKILLTISLLIIGFYLVAEHRAHIFDNAHYLLFMLFIGMHFFMHSGHGEQKKGAHHGK